MTNTINKIIHNSDEYVLPGDVKGPASSTDGHLALFDGSTGKLIKDGGSVPTVPTNISSFYNDSGYITGINSTAVINALGYTPYSSANPSGYISSETVVSGDSGTTYTIKVSNSDPTSGTPATTITFVS